MSKQQPDSSDVMSDELSDDITTLPPTYIVLKIAKDMKEATILWLIDKIRGKRRDGGAELIVMKQPINPDDVHSLFFKAPTSLFLIEN